MVSKKGRGSGTPAGKCILKWKKWIIKYKII